MWPLGFPEGSCRDADLRARWLVSPPGACLALVFASFPALLALIATPGKHWGFILPGPNPRRARMSWGFPSSLRAWTLPIPAHPLLLLQNAGNWIPCLRFGPAMSIVLGRIRWPSGTVSKRILGFGGNSLLRPSWCASTGVPHVPVVFLGPSFRLPWSFGLDLEAWRAAPGGLGTL